MESSNNDNVVSLAEFRQKKMEPKMKRTRHLESFVEGYHEAGPEATDVFNKTMMLLRAYGFETEDFDRKDVLLLREAIFSIILRYREEHHPLHSFVDEFDKYFNRLEFFLDSEWVKADFESFDDELDPNEEEPT
jgi:hypothetical protein